MEPIKLKKYDVVSVLRDGTSADFGKLSAKLNHIKDLCDILKSSLQVNDYANDFDYQRIDNILQETEICAELSEQLFAKLNYCVMQETEE